METSITVKLKSLLKRFFEGYKKIRKKNPFIDKTQQEKLNYLNSLQYSIVLRQKIEKFYLIIPELSLVTVSNKLEEAHDDLYKQKQNFFTKTLDCGAENEIILPRRTQEGREIFHKLKLFTYKLFIVCILGGLTFTISSALISNKIGEVSNILTNSAFDISKKFIKDTEKLLINAPEDIKQKRLERLHKLVEALQPFVQELETLSIPSHEEIRVKNKE